MSVCLIVSTGAGDGGLASFASGALVVVVVMVVMVVMAAHANAMDTPAAAHNARISVARIRLVLCNRMGAASLMSIATRRTTSSLKS